MEPMITKRSMFALTAHRGYLYAVGGANESYQALSGVERIGLREGPDRKW